MSPYYREQLTTQYLEFNQTYANELLDAAGYDVRDGEGYRLTPEGHRINFTITVVYEANEYYLSAAQMLSEYWHELGINVNVTSLKRNQVVGIINENDHDVIVESVLGGIDVVQSPGIYMPYNKYQSYFAIPWAYWYGNNSLGEEPPAIVKEQMQLYDQIKMTVDQDTVIDLMDQVLAIAESEFYVMGICKNRGGYAVVKSNFHNVPLTMPRSFSYPTPAPTNPCQYYIEPET